MLRTLKLVSLFLLLPATQVSAFDPYCYTEMDQFLVIESTEYEDDEPSSESEYDTESEPENDQEQSSQQKIQRQLEQLQNDLEELENWEPYDEQGVIQKEQQLEWLRQEIHHLKHQ